MKNKIHIIIELILVALLIGVVVYYRRTPLKVDFPFGEVVITAKSFGKQSKDKDIVIYLDRPTSVGGLLPIITMTPGSEKYVINLMDKDGYNIHAEYNNDGSGPFYVARTFSKNGKSAGVIYDDFGEVTGRAEKP